jgi:nucleoid-associated protein YgaU
VAAGGSITDEEVRNTAAGHLEALRALSQERGSMPETEWTSRRDELVEALREQQFLLARSLGARSLHRVQANDTLAGISRAIYGRAGDWPRIYEANRHLLENPDRLFPGMTLVVP